MNALAIAHETLTADRNPTAVYLARLSEGSRRGQRQALETLASIVGIDDPMAVPWHRLRYQHTQAIRQKLTGAPATINVRLSALRGVLREAWRLGLMSAEDFERASDLPSVKGSRLPAGRAVDSGELRALYKAVDASAPAGARDAALLSVLYAGGLRRAEATALDLESWDDREECFRVIGKGNKERLVHFNNGALASIRCWLERRGAEPGPFFLPVHRSGSIQHGQRMTEQAIALVLRRLANAAQVVHFSPHDLRRSFISDSLDAGVDTFVVQRRAGHANPQTTARYDRRGDAALKRAAGMLHVPFRAPRG